MPGIIQQPEQPPESPILPIPERDVEGVDLTVLGYSELVPPPESSGRLAVTGAIIDLAVRGRVRVEEIASGAPESDFALIKNPPPYPKEESPPLHEEYQLIDSLFGTRGAEKGKVLLSALAASNEFVPRIDEIRQGVRERMAEKQYFGRAPRELLAARARMFMAGLGLAAISAVLFATHETLPGEIGLGIGGPLILYSIISLNTDFRGLKPLGHTGRKQLKELLDATAERSFHADEDAYYAEDASYQAFESVRQSPEAMTSHERALAFMKLVNTKNHISPWALYVNTLSHLYTATPAWFTPTVSPQPGNTSSENSQVYDADSFADSLSDFIERMDAILKDRSVKPDRR